MTPTSILTFSGRFLDFQHPQVSQIVVEDIALALSREARFSGHTSEFYSVAQHSVHVSHLVPFEFALEALLHDATEAYCRDIPTPLKRLLPDYQKIERAVDAVIRQKFDLPMTMSKEVADADHIALLHEMASFTKHSVPPMAGPSITALDSRAAERSFLGRYYDILRTIQTNKESHAKV